MAHDHSHHHHAVAPANMSTRFVVGIILNMAFVLIEVVAGIQQNSMALLSDAGHNLADVGALALSLFAFRLLKLKSNENFTYGYRKTSILVSLLNSIILLISIGIIVFEAAQRLFHSQPVQGLTISVIAAIGIAINFISAKMFFAHKEHDINVKAAYLHLIADGVISLGIVIAGIAIYYTNWFWLDPAISIVIAIIILKSTWQILKDSLRLSLDGVPVSIGLADIKKEGMKIKGIKDIHHVHIWAMSTTENALTAHLVLQNDINFIQEQKIKDELKHSLLHKNIHHITLETERENALCASENC
ncbi:MAG: cation diffusion facilitator family transporter [Ginsengibacter sp.]